MSSFAQNDLSDDLDNPELTDRDVARMRPAREVLSEAAYAKLTNLSQVELVLSADTIAAFALDGDDWRERMSAALDQAAKAKRAA